MENFIKVLKLRQLFSFYLLLILLPLLVFLAQKAVTYFIGALGEPANLIIDVQSPPTPLSRSCQTLAQGGEVLPPNYLTPLQNQIKLLSVSYIRLDHLFDKYITVTKTGDAITLDFTLLDQQVKQILATGALPFFSLSYMPPPLAQSDITSPPKNWSDWRFIVQKTIEHYSGTFQGGMSLPNLYYEAWNEPDLFGNWKTYGNRNYLDLYRQTSLAATSAKVTHDFKLGGPATTGFYPAWIESLLKTASQENFKLDFISWHRYSPNPSDFQKDSLSFADLAIKYPAYGSLPRLITEWGSSGENHSSFDNFIGAAHLISSCRELIDSTELAFTFEIQDGESPEGKPYWGRWGIFTSPNSRSLPKPRYFALLLLNQLPQFRLPVSGEGSWVKSIATIEAQQVSLLITNYDSHNSHSETVPITLTNIPPGVSQYTLSQIDLFGKIITEKTLPVTNRQVTTSLFFSPNQTFLLRFTPNP